MDNMDKITEWAKAVKENERIAWEDLPDLELYMDQVLTFMNRHLSLFQKNEDNKLLTSNMINNYVKDGLIPRPEKKKYAREHLALMLVVCMLKQVLTIQNIAVLKDNTEDSEKLFNRFTSSQADALRSVCSRVMETDRTPEAMRQLALELSIEANARRITAENILAMLKEKPSVQQKNEHDKKKEKKQESK